MDFFHLLPQPATDPIFAITAEAKAAGPGAINGTIGVYAGDDGKQFVFPSVQKALEDLSKNFSTRTFDYPPLQGLQIFRDCVGGLLFKKDHPPVSALATTGGTGAVAMNLRLLKLMSPDITVIVPVPTWPNHKPMCIAAGLHVTDAPYLLDGKPSVDGIADAINKQKGDCAVLLHAGCHNPTGLDFSAEQWKELAEVLQKKGVIAILDFAYQGFANTPEEDALPIHLFVETGIPVLVCWSASKNHSLYGLRVGMAAAVAGDEKTKEKIGGHYSILTRRLHSAAATFGQEVVAHVQQNYKKEWLNDLADARESMTRKRDALRAGLPQELLPSLAGNGMFAVLPLSSPQIDLLKKQHNVFLVGDGRLNVAGLPLARIPEFCDKVKAVL